MKIGISFKAGEEEMYKFLQGQLSPSIYIKQLIKNEMEKEEKPKEMERKRARSLDFD